MKTPTSFPVFSIFYLLLLLSTSTGITAYTNFAECLVAVHFVDVTTNDVVYTPVNTTYTSVLQSTIQNLRFLSPSTPRPLAIITPIDESQIQIALGCALEYGVEVRIRAGGHDSEGLSYTSKVPFVIIDLSKLRKIDIDAVNGTAWIQAGVTVSELYYRIAQKSSALGFPGSTWPSIGVSGFLSGGGYGTLMRKYGLGADNVIDIQFMDKNGNIFIGKGSIGKDVFWAIRGGTASSYGIVLAWKVKLVHVPKIVTVFQVRRTLEQNATNLVYKFQSFAAKTERNLYVRAQIKPINLVPDGKKKTVQVSFQALYLGGAKILLKIMQEGFPELALAKKDCQEMSWAKSTLWFAGNGGFPKGESLEELLNINLAPKLNFKVKTDFVQKPISLKGLEGIWRRLMQQEEGSTELSMTPYGGKMDDISESQIPFPHRAGNLYMLLQGVSLNTSVAAQTQRLKWLRSLSEFLTPYVSKNPRRSYVNFNDLDLGMGNKTYKEASAWGTRYFNNNFKRLVQVKNFIDSENIFRHEQSIPLFPSIS